jgi:hypothetical protein
MTLMYAADCGWPLDRQDLKNMIMQYCNDTKIDVPWDKKKGPGVDFLRNFEKRWKHLLSTRRTVVLTTARAQALNPEILEKFFDLLKDVYDEHGLHDRPSAIYNLDETGMSTDQSGQKCFFRRGAKDSHILSPNCGKAMYTVLSCGNADGSCLLSPFVVYKAMHLHATWCYGGPDGTTFAVSPSGWMESQQFENWMKIFIVHKKHHHQDETVALFVDGQSSHLTYRVASLCRDNNVSAYNYHEIDHNVFD